MKIRQLPPNNVLLRITSLTVVVITGLSGCNGPHLS
jgi:hypothetical protein